MAHVPSTDDASAFRTPIADNTTAANRQAAVCPLDFPGFIDNHPIRVLKRFSGHYVGNHRCRSEQPTRIPPRLCLRAVRAPVGESWMPHNGFQCPECGLGDHEVGHMVVEGEVYCIVCMDEQGRLIRVHLLGRGGRCSGPLALGRGLRGLDRSNLGSSPFLRGRLLLLLGRLTEAFLQRCHRTRAWVSSC